jgi:Glycyl-tRNA synthetase alpha subunit
MDTNGGNCLQEAMKLLGNRLPIPAYDHILKLSHFFNLLDSRGAVGLTERQDNFARMRNLARRVSEVFQERRSELQYPLGKVPPVPVWFCITLLMLGHVSCQHAVRTTDTFLCSMCCVLFGTEPVEGPRISKERFCH